MCAITKFQILYTKITTQFCSKIQSNTVYFALIIILH